MHVGTCGSRASVSGPSEGPAVLLSVASLQASSTATVGPALLAIWFFKGLSEEPTFLLSIVSLQAYFMTTVGSMLLATCSIKLHFSWVDMSSNRH